MKEVYTYDDIQLVPQYSEIESRRVISLKTRLSKNFNLNIPYIASPMDTICESGMAIRLMGLGGVGCIHRFMSIEQQAEQVKSVWYIAGSESLLNEVWYGETIPIMAAIGANGDFFERAIELHNNGANVLLIDVAHGHHKNVKEAIRNIKSRLPIDVIAGNIATYEGAKDLVDWGADGVRVGIGGGCFTPDMKVRTDTGLKRIEDIQLGDMVYTHTGELKPVFNKFIYEDYDEIYDIDGIEATANHKFYVVHQSKVDLIQNDEDIHRYAEWKRADELSDEYFTIQLD